MRATGSAMLPLVVLGMLAGFTFWLEQSTQDEGGGNHAKLRHDPDFWVENFTLRRFDNEGDIQHLLTAKRMEHFPDDESTEVASPYLAYFKGRKSIATARTAWLDKEGKHVRLNDEVRVVRPGIDGGPDTIVTTSVLNVVPDDEYAQTDAPVTLTQGQTVLHGVGLEVSNKTQVAVLSGPVQGTIMQRKDK
jgi:lipopolysaccharide export system protein LptC